MFHPPWWRAFRVWDGGRIPPSARRAGVPLYGHGATSRGRTSSRLIPGYLALMTGVVLVVAATIPATTLGLRLWFAPRLVLFVASGQPRTCSPKPVEPAGSSPSFRCSEGIS